MTDVVKADEVVDATIPVVEAVYYRYFRVFADVCESVEEALEVLSSGEEHGSLSSVGVVVDGEPHIADPWLNPHPPTAEEAAEIRENYAKRTR